mgnify:CR=1 FL=1
MSIHIFTNHLSQLVYIFFSMLNLGVMGKSYMV